MKNFISRYLLPFTFFLLTFLLTGCFEDEVTFKGRAYRADTALIILGMGEYYETTIFQGPVSGAKVREAGHSEVTTTDANGNYTLKISVPRVIGLEKAKTYRLQCWWAGSTSAGNPSQSDDIIILPSGAGDEPIMNYAEAKAGDTIEVRDFILHQHTIEKYPDTTGTGGGGGSQ